MSLPTNHALFFVATPLLGTQFARDVGIDNDDLNTPRDMLHAIVQSDEVSLSPKEIEDAVWCGFRRFYLRPDVIAHHASRSVGQPQLVAASALTAFRLLRYIATGQV